MFFACFPWVIFMIRKFLGKLRPRTFFHFIPRTHYYTTNGIREHFLFLSLFQRTLLYCAVSSRQLVRADFELHWGHAKSSGAGIRSIPEVLYKTQFGETQGSSSGGKKPIQRSRDIALPGVPSSFSFFLVSPGYWLCRRLREESP